MHDLFYEGNSEHTDFPQYDPYHTIKVDLQTIKILLREYFTISTDELPETKCNLVEYLISYFQRDIRVRKGIASFAV